MWRAFFLAVGICLLLAGIEFLILEKVIMSTQGSGAMTQAAARLTPGAREFAPPDWAPWSLLAAGAVVILYTFTLPKRVSG